MDLRVKNYNGVHIWRHRKARPKLLGPYPEKTERCRNTNSDGAETQKEKQKLGNNRAETLGQWSRSSKDTAM